MESFSHLEVAALLPSDQFRKAHLQERWDLPGLPHREPVAGRVRRALTEVLERREGVVDREPVVRALRREARAR